MAKKMEEREYWNRMRLAELENQNVANKLLDMGVNMGVRPGIGLCAACAQRYRRTDGRVTEDGVIGAKTLADIHGADPD